MQFPRPVTARSSYTCTNYLQVVGNFFALVFKTKLLQKKTAFAVACSVEIQLVSYKIFPQ